MRFRTRVAPARSSTPTAESACSRARCSAAATSSPAAAGSQLTSTMRGAAGRRERRSALAAEPGAEGSATTTSARGWRHRSTVVVITRASMSRRFTRASAVDEGLLSAITARQPSRPASSAPANRPTPLYASTSARVRPEGGTASKTSAASVRTTSTSASAPSGRGLEERLGGDAPRPAGDDVVDPRALLRRRARRRRRRARRREDARRRGSARPGPGARPSRRRPASVTSAASAKSPSTISSSSKGCATAQWSSTTTSLLAARCSPARPPAMATRNVVRNPQGSSAGRREPPARASVRGAAARR